MNKFFNTIAGASLIAFSSFSFADELPGTSYDISISSIATVIEEVAEETLYPDGSETKSNCRKDSHCVAFSYANGCSSANYSNYKSRGAEEAIIELAELIDESGAIDYVCGSEVTEATCNDDNRCEFEVIGG